jgi:hypothetical protein
MVVLSSSRVLSSQRKRALPQKCLSQHRPTPRPAFYEFIFVTLLNGMESEHSMRLSALLR